MYRGGETEYCINLKKIKVEAGTLLFLSPGQSGLIGKETSIEGICVAFSPHFYDNMEPSLAYLLRYQLFRSINSLKIDNEKVYEIIKDYFVILDGESKVDTLSPFHNLNLFSFFYFIVVKIYDYYTKLNNCICEINPSLELFIRFSEMIDKHYDTQHLVREYIDALNVNYKDLEASVKEYSGKTPHDMILEKSVFEAKRLLAYTNLSIKEISTQLGYKEQSNFSLTFKKYAKSNPSAYREQRRVKGYEEFPDFVSANREILQ